MRVIILIGASGSGKSTWATKDPRINGILEIEGYDPEVDLVSSDDIREWVFGDAANQHPSIWRVIRAVIRAKIESGLSETLVIDATNAKRKDRVAMINDVRSWIKPEDTVEGIYFDVPKQTLLERNASRDRQVPRHAIDAQYSALKSNPPTVEDGFDALHLTV